MGIYVARDYTSETHSSVFYHLGYSLLLVFPYGYCIIFVFNLFAVCFFVEVCCLPQFAENRDRRGIQ